MATWSISRILTAALLLASACAAATLEKLSMDDLVNKSTSIVRGRVVSTRTAFRGPMIYTFATVQVSERWKGTAAATVEVASPGGRVGTQEQTFSGSPALAAGSEYVFFLWTGKSGITQIMGLCQGLFDVKLNAAGETIVARAASNEVMLDPATGTQINDVPVVLRLKDMTARINRIVGMGGTR